MIVELYGSKDESLTGTEINSMLRGQVHSNGMNGSSFNSRSLEWSDF